MEAQNKEKSEEQKNKKKFNFGNLKIKNKIIFGFFVVSIISGLVNYYSNSFIVSEFSAVNNTMNEFHNIFAMQKKLEIVVESFVASESIASVSISEFDSFRGSIENKFEQFTRMGNLNMDDELISRFASESDIFYRREAEVVLTHGREIAAKDMMNELEMREKQLRYQIRDYVESLEDIEIYTAFLYSEYEGKEMLYQYRNEEKAKEWLTALNKARDVAEQKKINVPGFGEYYDIASKTSDAVIKVEAILKSEDEKMRGFRSSVRNLNDIQDEISKTITQRNLQKIDSIILIGVAAFIFVLMFFTILFGYVISTFISRPIMELAEFAKMAAKADFKKRIDAYTDDEIGQTAKAFNQMLDKVEESKMLLEIKVNARTKRLEDLSRNLEVQIDNKTKELNDKIAELERFNDLAVGRELRMIELKREIEILRQKSGDKVRNFKRTSSFDKDVANCWDFWSCEKAVRDRCPAYLSNSGRECWMVAAGKCPRSKERGVKYCKDCLWYKKINKID